MAQGRHWESFHDCSWVYVRCISLDLMKMFSDSESTEAVRSDVKTARMQCALTGRAFREWTITAAAGRVEVRLDGKSRHHSILSFHA